MRGKRANQRNVSVSKNSAPSRWEKANVRSNKNLQFNQAIKFCADHEVGAKEALARNKNVWPLIKATALHNRIHKKVVTSLEWATQSMLTPTERRDLADCMEAAGKAGFGFDREERNQTVVDILIHRDSQNRKGGRKVVKLNKTARQCIARGRPGKSFWQNFFVEFNDRLHITAEKVTSIQRLKQCTKAVAAKHVDDLIELLTEKGIYDPLHHCIAEGKEGNIIWEDEMGQFFQFRLLSGNDRNIVGAKGVPAKSAESENRQQFSYDGAIGGDMHVYEFHLLFRAENFSADMAPNCLLKYPHAMISVTEKGCQVSSTFLARQKGLLAQARARGIEGDIVFVTDGHASRFSVELLRWLRASKVEDESCVHGNDMYITPPNATGSCCVLDQLFQSLHRKYGRHVRNCRTKHGHGFTVSRFEAISIMVEIHDSWCSLAEKHRAFRVCGLDMTGLLCPAMGMVQIRSSISIHHFPAKNFIVGDTITAAALSPIVPQSHVCTDSSFVSDVSSSNEVSEPTPSPSIPRLTPAYYEAKVTCLKKALELANQGIVKAEETRVHALLLSPSPLECGVVKTTFVIDKKKSALKISD